MAVILLSETSLSLTEIRDCPLSLLSDLVEKTLAYKRLKSREQVENLTEAISIALAGDKQLSQKLKQIHDECYSNFFGLTDKSLSPTKNDFKTSVEKLIKRKKNND